MLFTSPIFLFLFLPIVLAVNALVPARLRNLWLLLASLVFYAWGEMLFTLVMLTAIAANYGFGLWVDRARGTPAARAVLALTVATNLALLAVMKYSNFAVENMNAALVSIGATGLPPTAIALPLGISFFTFHAVSYVVDVHRGDAEPQRNPLDLAVYFSLLTRPMADSEATATRRTANLVLVLLFFAGVIAPCLGTILRLQTGGIAGENRSMARRPSFAVGTRQLPRQIDAWFNDHFGFRNVLVEAHGLIAYGVFGVSSSPDVVPGRDGWLFYAADRIVESRRGLLPFTGEALAAWQAKLEERRDWLAARRIRYVFTVAPEKSSLYAELLPPALQPVGGQTRADQLLAWMRAHSTVEIVDLREALRAAKAVDRIYHRTDTHWNDLGAFAAYRSLAEWMQGPFPTVRAIDAGEFDRQVRITPAGDLAGMMALMPLLSEARIALVPKTPSPLVPRHPTAIMKRRAYLPHQEPKVFACPTGEIGSAVVVHDSFVLPMQPSLARHFRRSTFLHEVFAPDVIAAERPDLVIEEMVERMLSRPGFLPASELAAFNAADGS